MGSNKESLFGSAAELAGTQIGQQQQSQPYNQAAAGVSDEGEAPAVSAEEQREIEKEAAAALTLPPTLAQQGQTSAALTPAWAQFELDIRFAKAFMTSGLFGLRGKGKASIPPQQAAAAAFVRIQVGRSLGFDPAQSMMGISVVNDKPVVEYNILAARCKAIGYDWEPYFTQDKATGRCTGCRLFLKKDGRPVMQTKRDAEGMPIQKRDSGGKLIVDDAGEPVYDAEQVSVAFTEQDAKRIKQEKWVGSGPTARKESVSLWEKDTYSNYGSNMMFSRAFHNLQRFHMSEALNAPVFLKEAREADDVIDTYESGPDKFSTYGDDPARAEASESLRKLQQQHRGDVANTVIDVPIGGVDASGENKKAASGFSRR